MTVIGSIISSIAKFGWAELATTDWSIHIAQILTAIGLIWVPDAKKVDEKLDKLEEKIDSTVGATGATGATGPQGKQGIQGPAGETTIINQPAP